MPTRYDANMALSQNGNGAELASVPEWQESQNGNGARMGWCQNGTGVQYCTGAENCTGQPMRNTAPVKKSAPVSYPTLRADVTSDTGVVLYTRAGKRTRAG